MSISKRLRYEILKRDGNKCRYCGAPADESPLTIDHVVPVALGGTDDPSNLVSACKDCNAGKSSSNPDATLVATIADDAVRWSLALQHAGGQMLADLEARQRDRESFLDKWERWKTNSGTTVPLPGGWMSSIDQFIAAGLPMPALLDCVDKAMGVQKVALEGKFRYLCGIAWKKVRELQDAARGAVIPGGVAVELGDPYREAVDRMFGTIGEFDRAGYVEEMAERFDLEHEDDEDEHLRPVSYSHWPADLKALALCVENVANEHWAWSSAGEALLAKFPHAERREAIERAVDELEKHLDDFTPEQVTREALRYAVLESLKDEQFTRTDTIKPQVDF